jgi:hypothetical protein
MWLQAIEVYNSKIVEIRLQGKTSEKYNFSFDEITQISKSFTNLNTLSAELDEENDRQLFSKII